MNKKVSLFELLRDDIDRALGRSGERLLHSVELYGGEFTAAEIAKHATAAPACLLTCLGWNPAPKGSRIGKGRAVRLAFFIVTKTSNRADRMMQATAIAERLDAWLQDWKCTEQVLNGCVGGFYDTAAENLYGRASDAKGLGLWLVRATIDVSYCALRTPLVQHGGSLEQYMSTLLVPTVEIESTPHIHVDDDRPSEASNTLTQHINIGEKP